MFEAQSMRIKPSEKIKYTYTKNLMRLTFLNRQKSKPENKRFESWPVIDALSLIDPESSELWKNIDHLRWLLLIKRNSSVQFLNIWKIVDIESCKNLECLEVVDEYVWHPQAVYQLQVDWNQFDLECNILWVWDLITI